MALGLFISFLSALSATGPAAAAAAVTASGDGSMTITEAVGANEPSENAPLATLFPTTDAGGYPWFPASNTTVTCVHQDPTQGIHVVAAGSLPCGTRPADVTNGNGVADRLVIDG